VDELQRLPPEWLARALIAVMSDLQRPESVRFEVTWDADEQIIWFREATERDRAGFSPGDRRGAQLMVELADWLQEQVFPESGGAWGEARPECPGHAHPALPFVEADGEAWWVCPTAGPLIKRIGVR
jgi:hypothetical protein